MKALERIFLYTVLAILVFYVFLIDNNAESQVAIQEEIRARSILIVNDAGQEVVKLWANKNGGIVSVYNKIGTPVAGICTFEYGGAMGVNNKAGNPVVNIMGFKGNEGDPAICVYSKDGNIIVALGDYKDDGLIEVYNKKSDMIGSLP